jgi:UDP-sugar transporter A1/2/3
VLTTAGFSGLLLGRQFSYTQWRAMLLLILGCILVASPTIESASEKGAESAKGTEAVLGVCSLLTMVSISGFCSVYFEGILKDEREKCTIWERNFQLSMFSILLLVIYNFMERNNEVLSGRSSGEGQAALFEGWTINTVIICLLQSSGGLLVALTLKYADSIIKSLVTAGAIVLSTLFGYFLLGGVLNMYVGIGCAVTITAIFNYMFVETAP